MKAIPYLLGVGLIVLLVASGFELRNLKSEYSLDQFYPTEHPLLQGNDKIIHRFRLQKESPYLHVIELSKNDWIKKENIAALKKLTLEIEQKQNVKNVLSLTHVEGASNSTAELSIGSIFERAPASSWADKVLEDPLLYPLLITKDFSATLLMVEPRDKDQKKLMALEEDIHTLIQKTFPQAKIHSAGVPLLQTRLSNLISSELGLFLIATSVVFCIVFFVIFSHWTAIACAFFSLIAANIFTLALMSLFKISMNAILVTLPVIVSVSVMSLLVHTLHLWSQRRTDGPLDVRWKQTCSTLKEIWLPNTLGIATTALGFLALAPSTIPLIGQYGLTVCLLLTFVAFLNQLLMLVLLPWVKPTMRNWFSRPAQWALIGIKRPWFFLLPMIWLLGAGVILAPKLNFSARLFDDLPESDAVRSSTEWIDNVFGGTLNYDLLAHSESADFWRKPENLRKLQIVLRELRTITNVGTAMTVTDFLSDIGSREEVAETFFLFSLAQKNPLGNFMTEDGKSMRIALRLKDIPAQNLEVAKKDILQLVQNQFPEITFSEGGITSYAHAINNEVAESLIYDFWQPLLLIGLFLVIMFRSFKWAILSCLPNFVPPAALITALALSNVAVKPGIALIFSIALGFAFNNTLYILNRLKEHKGSSETALSDALLQEGNPCLFESLIMFAGFSLFLFSDFTMNQTFGGFMLLSIIAGFAADLFCLPALLKVFPALYQRQAKLNPEAVVILLAITLVSPAVFAAESAKDVLKKSQVLLDAKDDKAKVEMKIIEENGEIKTRTVTLQTLREKGFSVLARIESPADIKDMAFLGNVDTEGNEMQWIYLPSSNSVRRLVTGENKSGLLGSEISPEDLNSEAIKSASVKMAKGDKGYHWIEITPMKGKSDYSKVLTKISKEDYLPKETLYFVAGKLKKTVEFKNYKKIGPVWRAHSMIVKNHLNKRGTEVLLTDVKVNTGLGADDFSQTSLKDN